MDFHYKEPSYLYNGNPYTSKTTFFNWDGPQDVVVKRMRDAKYHYCFVITGAMTSQITSLTIVYSTVHLGADQRKHQSSASKAFARGIHRWSVNSPHKWSVTRKMLPFDDVIMIQSLQYISQIKLTNNYEHRTEIYIYQIHFPTLCSIIEYRGHQSGPISLLDYTTWYYSRTFHGQIIKPTHGIILTPYMYVFV